MARGPRIVVLALTLLVAGCSSGGSSSDQSGDDPARPTASSTAATSSPAVSSETTSTPAEPVEPERLTPDLQALIDRYDLAVAGILADPSVAADRAHPAVREYLALFPPDSEFAGGALTSWAQMDGRYYRPGARGRVFESTVSDVEVDDDAGEATFQMCVLQSIEIVDGAGRPVEGEEGWNAADGVAVLVDGEWLLQDLTQVPPQGCAEDGGTP